MTDVKVAAENLEATEAWNGPLFDVWKDFQAIVVSNAKAHGDAALADHRPQPGERVLDIGCGLGDSTMQLAELVGAEGHVHGVDVAERMIHGARADTVSDILRHAGCEEIELKRQDRVIKIGDDLSHAIDLVMSIGPAGEVLRLWGDRVGEIRPKVRAALEEGMADMAREDGAFADSSTWAIRAVAP